MLPWGVLEVSSTTVVPLPSSLVIVVVVRHLIGRLRLSVDEAQIIRLFHLDHSFG